ncbi:hypothetical protein DPMN_168759 [Dreissena polymorpha]|uniref:Uncharacterized protein n=1 Tax=Dreissena polymorpha TaxID=45954 RepID=A0A9D4F2G2_DREPO|nr:hypothetical protein DPMN_168759 [Dreissena polymorpha]
MSGNEKDSRQSTDTFRVLFHVSHFRRDCRGKFFDSLKFWHGNHGNPVVSRLAIPFPYVASRSSRFLHDGPKRDCRGRREHGVNAALACCAFRV